MPPLEQTNDCAGIQTTRNEIETLYEKCLINHHEKYIKTVSSHTAGVFQTKYFSVLYPIEFICTIPLVGTWYITATCSCVSPPHNIPPQWSVVKI